MAGEVKHWYVGSQECLLLEDLSFLQVNIEDGTEVRMKDQEIVFQAEVTAHV